MKPQDIIFIIIIVALLGTRNPKYFTIAGLVCLLLAIPLFQFWVFFTAERLVMYAAGFFFLAIIFFLFRARS